jgi:Zn-dependent protease
LTFSRREILELLIAWLVLGLCFAIGEARFGIDVFLVYLGIVLIGLLAGFVVHELAHKYAAQRFGAHAEFRLWRIGLILAVAVAVISQGDFLFAAPGAVYIAGYLDKRQDGLVSVSGPLANILMAALFFLLSTDQGMAGVIGTWGFRINLWLAAFNLLPVGPLDGRGVMAWNWRVWVLMTTVAWGTLALMFMGFV